MARQLYTYSLIKALYDKGQDYIDCFWPLVISVLPIEQKGIALTDLQAKVEGRFGLKVPTHSLETVLTRAARKELVIMKRKAVSLTDEGKLQLASLEIERDVERRVNELIDAATDFLNHALNDNVTVDECRTLLLGFVQSNLDYLLSFINPKASAAASNSPKFEERSRELMLLRFFIHVEKSVPRLFEALVDVILGSVMSLAVYGENPDEAVKRFSKTLVYLDTNIVFSLLGLHFQEFNKPAKELFDLMKNEGQFELRVFDFTVEEIVNVLRNYGVNRSLYFQNVRVASIYSSLASNGWTNSKVLELICEIEERLASVGILVTTTGSNLVSFEPSDAKLLESIASYKPNQGKRGRLHDLAAIEHIEKLRKGRVRRIKDAGVLFLTSDRRLARFAFVEKGHRDYATISEVIPDRLLTNLLWLKNPGAAKGITIDAIISVHSRGLFVDKDVWGVFYRTIAEAAKSGKVTDLDITVLLYDSNVQTILLELSPEKASETIGEQWIVDSVQQARARLNKDQQEALEKQRSGFEATIAVEKTEYLKRIEGLIGTFRDRVSKSTDKQFKWLSRSFKAFVIGILAVAFRYSLSWVISRWSLIEPTAWVGSGLLGFALWTLGEKSSPRYLRKKLADTIHQHLLHRNKITLGLADLEKEITKTETD